MIRNVDKKLKKMLDKALIGTYLNYNSNESISAGIWSQICEFIKLETNNPYKNDLFDYISRETRAYGIPYGIPLRETLLNYYYKNPVKIANSQEITYKVPDYQLITPELSPSNENTDLMSRQAIIKPTVINNNQNYLKPEIALAMDFLTIATKETFENTYQYLAIMENGKLNIYGKIQRFAADGSAPKQEPITEEDYPKIKEAITAEYGNNNPEIRIWTGIKEGINKISSSSIIINYYKEKFFTTNKESIKIPSDENMNKLNNSSEYRILEVIEKLTSGQNQDIKILQKYVKDKISLDDIETVIRKYCRSLNAEEVFNNEKIEIEEITATGVQIMSNADGFNLKDSFNGILLEGKIQLSADKGYPSRKYAKQQDAVGSAVRDERHFINVLADGVGGGSKGEETSRKTVEKITQWYKNLPIQALEDTEFLKVLLKQKLDEIDSQIYVENNFNKNAQTTFVIALTNGDDTIIANIGDSTAYSYNQETDELQMLTTLDSRSYGLSYDDARFNPNNNVITASYGAGFNEKIHINVIENNGQRIILSSDGVTDLVSEKNFKNFFKNKTAAQSIVEKAKNAPDEYDPRRGWLSKTEDNISAIVIDLPSSQMSKRRGL